MRTGEIWPVLITGGRGTRFWPLSRKSKPKPLLALGSDRPMIAAVCALLEPLSGPDKIFIATSRELAPALKKILPSIPAENYALEPEPRDTAPALGLSLALCSRRLDPAQPEPALAFIPSDLHAQKKAAFRQALKTAGALARSRDLIVVIGVKPDAPNPAYGYLQPGPPIGGRANIFMLKKFHEKPDLKTARRYVRRGFFWNAGVFVARPGVLWEAFRRHQPETHARLQRILRAPAARLERVVQKEFPRLKKTSFDYAIMEKWKATAMVTGDFGWTDLGGFSALDRIAGKDRIKNLGSGRLVTVASDRLLVLTRKLTAAVGVKDLVIVETEDAILIMDREREPELKRLVLELERLGLKQYL
jgi:mannose-1-phosphate guanylyltransferase